LHRTNIGVTPLGITMLAAIQILSINFTAGPALAQADEDISITGNEIDDTPRTGIWVMNIHSGQIADNTIRHSSYDPSLPSGSHINRGFLVTGRVAAKDFEEPLVIQSSNVTLGVNTSEGH
ncbi:MAG TPA: hypothetical protein VE641_12775, partial [Chthoniobacterales bacterium]|nr:hypothetical protein [Chthoniobacterales bacterium]